MTTSADWGLFPVPPGYTQPAERRADADDSRKRQHPPVNDMDLIEAVLQHALDPGYVLTGSGERVWRRDPHRNEDIQPVNQQEAAAVHQLLDSRLLTRGGRRSARYGTSTGLAVSVLVTPAARAQLCRWRAYLRPACWGRPSTSPTERRLA